MRLRRFCARRIAPAQPSLRASPGLPSQFLAHRRAMHVPSAGDDPMKLFGPLQKSLLVLVAAAILYAVVAGVDWYGARREVAYFNDLHQVAPPGVVDAMME